MSCSQLFPSLSSLRALLSLPHFSSHLLRLHFLQDSDCPLRWVYTLPSKQRPQSGADPSHAVPTVTTKYKILLQALPGLTKVLGASPQMFLLIFAFSIGCGHRGSWPSCPLVQISTAHWLCWHDPGLTRGSGWGQRCCWKEEAYISSVFICEDSSWPNQSHPGDIDTQKAIPECKRDLVQKAGAAGPWPAGGLQWAFNLFNHW